MQSESKAADADKPGTAAPQNKPQSGTGIAKVGGLQAQIVEGMIVIEPEDPTAQPISDDGPLKIKQSAAGAVSRLLGSMAHG